MHVFPLLGFIEIKTALLVFHLVGLALGAGVAFFSAILFMKVMHDGYVTKKEMQILSITSTTVAIGLSLLALSGLGLFLLNQTAYLASAKFLAKMSIVGVLIVNGIFIHHIHMVALKKHVDTNLKKVPGFKIRSYAMYVGGALSMTSWLSALTLGAFRSVPYSYGTIMLVYVGVVIVASILSLLLHHFTFARRTTRD